MKRGIKAGKSSIEREEEELQAKKREGEKEEGGKNNASTQKLLQAVH